MPIVKAINAGPDKVLTYHTVERVEFCRVNGELLWSGHYRSFTDGEEARQPGGRARGHDIAAGVPLVSLGTDPIAAFEAASVLHPKSEFFGGQVVPHATVYAPAEWARKVQWEAVKIGRDAHLDAGVTTTVGRFDSDLNTLVNVLGAAATMLDGDTRGWILADHSPVVLSKAQVLELGAALATLRDTSYAQGSTLYAQIQAAQTAEAVRAVVWTPPA